MIVFDMLWKIVFGFFFGYGAMGFIGRIVLEVQKRKHRKNCRELEKLARQIYHDDDHIH